MLVPMILMGLWILGSNPQSGRVRGAQCLLSCWGWGCVWERELSAKALVVFGGLAREVGLGWFWPQSSLPPPPTWCCHGPKFSVLPFFVGQKVMKNFWWWLILRAPFTSKLLKQSKTLAASEVLVRSVWIMPAHNIYDKYEYVSTHLWQSTCFFEAGTRKKQVLFFGKSAN